MVPPEMADRDRDPSWNPWHDGNLGFGLGSIWGAVAMLLILVGLRWAGCV